MGQLTSTSLNTNDFLDRISGGVWEFWGYGPITSTGTVALIRRREDNTFQQILITDLSTVATFPTAVASYTQTGKVAAVTNAINFTPPATTGRLYMIGGDVNVTAWTTPASFTVVVTYTDDSGNARTETLAVQRGSTGAVAAAITAVDRWYFEIPLLAINNSATAITVSTSGTFTGSPVYNLAAALFQVA